MTYQSTWANGSAGRLAAAVQYARLSDVSELAAAVNRRRQLLYQPPQDFSSAIYAGAFVAGAAIATAIAPPFDNFRSAITGPILGPANGILGGQPSSPTSMQWLWPVAGADENNIIVTGLAGISSGQVGLFDQLNGQANWTDPSLAALSGPVRALHINELRQAIEWLSRGRWTMPIYFDAGLMSLQPDTPWVGNMIANNGAGQLQCVGQAMMIAPGLAGSPLGLTGVQVRPTSSIVITADTACTIELYRCLRNVCFASTDLPTWNQCDPGASIAWSAPGGTGAADAVLIGSYAVPAGVATPVSDAQVQAALGAIAGGAQQNFLIRRGDVGPQTIAIDVSLTVEFDLENPPN
jgi:hypothetical protein